ncbi:MAG TPA: YdcF family protein [Ilumatobacteraceae bacterium]|nr:YdcF family protein [Ilumatobacteraceae bacterium]
MTNGEVPTGEVPVTYSAEVQRSHEHEADFVDRRRRRTPFGIAVRVAVVLGAIVMTYYVVTLYQVWSTGRRDQARTVDAIVVLGAAQYDGRPSPQLAARLDQVVELWPRGLAPIVVVTGGKQPADRFTEAEASARYLVERGVPDSAILFENVGQSTYESLEGVADLLQARGLRSVLLVTDPFHALRSRLTAEELGLEAYVSPTDTSVVTGASSFARHLKEAAGISFGRIMGFDRLRGLTG